MSETFWWDKAIDGLQRGTLRRLFDDLALELSPADFVNRLEERLDAIMMGGVRMMVEHLPWDSLQVQLNVCYFNAWGEIRSADTFARQIERIGIRYPELKLVLARQLEDEMRHFMLFQTAALEMGGVDVLTTSSEERAGSLYRMFQYCDERSSDDVREQIFSCQFVDERFPLHLFEGVKGVPGLHPGFFKALESIVPDEKFHVRRVGRMAAELLAAEGGEAHRRMLDLASRVLPYTLSDKSANLAGS